MIQNFTNQKIDLDSIEVDLNPILILGCVIWVNVTHAPRLPAFKKYLPFMEKVKSNGNCFDLNFRL